MNAVLRLIPAALVNPEYEQMLAELHRRREQHDPVAAREKERARCRAYHWANREKILERQRKRYAGMTLQERSHVYVDRIARNYGRCP